MKQRAFILLILVCPITFLMIAGFGMRAAEKGATGGSSMAAQPPTGFAVVELFTSEGCSSCPPADDALAMVARDFSRPADHVYVLGFHVDYWDRLGWKDVYSNADYTKRQSEYARVMSLKSIYTPQAVVNGETEFVGSDGAKLMLTIIADLKKAAGKPIELHASFDGAKLNVAYKVPDADKEMLHVALVQKHAESQVQAGENGGQLLKHINVVRDFKSIEVHPGSMGTVSFSVPRGLAAKDCKVIAYLQGEGSSLAMTGAAEAEIL
jgi:hypothetical protein